jgi:hypothetical protein
MNAEHSNARAVCLPAKRRRNWLAAVRGSLDVRRILRELVRQSITLALTTKPMPKTAEDVAIIADEIAREVIP